MLNVLVMSSFIPSQLHGTQFELWGQVGERNCTFCQENREGRKEWNTAVSTADP